MKISGTVGVGVDRNGGDEENGSMGGGSTGSCGGNSVGGVQNVGTSGGGSRKVSGGEGLVMKGFGGDSHGNDGCVGGSKAIGIGGGITSGGSVGNGNGGGGDGTSGGAGGNGSGGDGVGDGVGNGQQGIIIGGNGQQGAAGGGDGGGGGGGHAIIIIGLGGGDDGGNDGGGDGGNGGSGEGGNGGGKYWTIGGGGGGGGGGGSGAPPSSSGEPVKKKRGRPRKYGPGGPVSLRLSATANSSPGSGTPLEKKRRGRPPGSGRKQQLASLGEWMNSSAGMAFSPHVISVEPGEDIVAKLLSFAQQRPRAVCIMSGTGIVSSVTMRQPASNTVSVTYEGRFQILCLSGSYLVADDGGARSRTGGISVSLSSPEGHVIGGGVAVLIAATPVQVVVCSFVYGGSSKAKPKQVTSTKDSGSEPQSSDKLASPASAPPPNQNYNSSSSAVAIWPGSQPADLKSAHPHTGIDLTRG